MLINKRAVNAGAPNLVNICIDKNHSGELTGRFYNRYSREPIFFDDVNDLLIQMDRLMDRIDFPQAAMKDRRFAAKSKGSFPTSSRSGSLKPGQGRRDRRCVRNDRRDAEVKTTDEILNETGKRATFLVNVQYRQNATWQGKVLWAETGESCHFRSALELLKLMDGAMEEAGEDAGEKDV